MTTSGADQTDVGARPPTVLHVGAFDLASYGDQLYPLISAHELGQRLEHVEVLPFGPLGTPGDGLADAGRCWALGPWSTHRASELARKADVVLCGGGEIVQGDGTTYAAFYGIDTLDAEGLRIDRWFLECLGSAEHDCPVVWHSPGVPSELDESTAARLRSALADRAMVAVRDERSRHLLENAGVDRAVEVVPDSALLLPRVLTPSLLDEERDRLEADGCYPPRPGRDLAGSATSASESAGNQVLVVQGNNTMARFTDVLASTLDALPPEVQIVTVAVSPCHDDHLFAAALSERLERETWNVPTTSLEGVAAAIAGADCFLGVSLHAAITAIAYERPSVTFDPFRQAKLASFLDLVGAPERRATDPIEAVSLAADLAHRHLRGELDGGIPRLAALQERIDHHFDRIAELVTSQVEARTRPPEPFTWSDTGNAQHLALGTLPLDATPLPTRCPDGLRLPDLEPTLDELIAAVAAATTARLSRRDVDQAKARELEELRRQNADLRGAIAHLEGVTTQLRGRLEQPRKGRRGRRNPLRGVRRPSVETLDDPS